MFAEAEVVKQASRTPTADKIPLEFAGEGSATIAKHCV